MDWRKLSTAEQFSSAVSSKRKVVSGFGLVLAASLFVFAVIFMKGFYSPPLFSRSLTVPRTLDSSILSQDAALQKPMNPWQKKREEKLGNGRGNRGSFSAKGDRRSHHSGKDEKMPRIPLQSVEGGEIGTEGRTISSKKDKGGSFFPKDREGVTEETQERGNLRNTSVSRLKGDFPEKTHEGNIPRKEERGASAGIEHAEATSSSERFDVLHNNSASLQMPFGKCDIFDGRWVRDEGKPYYPPGSCPYIDKEFDCFENGRPDDDFLQWRWQPNHCNIPRLNATDFLEKMRGKKLLFVGDSLNRNMWESLVCALRHSVANKSKVHEVYGRKEFRKSGYYSFLYEDYNCTVDFVRSPFLVQEAHFNGENGVEDALRLDVMDELTLVCQEAHVLVFNTGHWWTHEKTSRGENYYQEGSYIHPKLDVKEAFKKALTTWARWIDENIEARRTKVFFRGYSVSHFSGGRWNSGGQCQNETEPIFNDAYLGKYPWKMRTLENILVEMRTPVVYLNISKLTDYRKDGHPSIYRKESKTDLQTQDCSHWCLPGLPETWNQLLYAFL